MPLEIIATIGATDANSFVTMAEAENYHNARLNSAAWTDANADDKARALLMAANRLQLENWLGNRGTTTQRLAWPRLAVGKIDPVSVGFGYGGNWGYGGNYAYFTEVYQSNEIPQPVKDAQCELALAYLEGFDDGAEDAIDSFST